MWVALIIVSAVLWSILHLDSWILDRWKGRVLSGQDPWEINSYVLTLASKHRISAPKVYLIPTDAVQFGLVGVTRRTRHLVLTEGLLKTLSANEQKAVIAQLLSLLHREVGLGAAMSFVLITFVVGTGFLLDYLFRVVTGVRNDKKRLASHFFTWVLSPLAYLILKIFLPNSTYFEGDSSALALSGNPGDLASALWKVDSYSRTKPFEIDEPFVPFFMINPLQDSPWKMFFTSQPDLDKRIRKIIGHFPV